MNEGKRMRVRDDRSRVFDSTLAYFVSQLDVMDPKLHAPLYSVSWGRDIKLRSGISMANESTSFIRSNVAAMGSQSASGKPWLAPNATTLPGVTINGERVVLPLRLLGREISYTSIELERSQLLGQPIDQSKFAAFNVGYQMDTDEMVYIGDTGVTAYGLCNSPLVTAAGVTADGTGSSALWSTKTPDQIVRDVNDALNASWLATGYAVCPDKILLPPAKFAYIVGTKVSTSADKSILKYIQENTICNSVNGRPLDIQPCKWLTGRGAGSTDRMVLYTNDEERVRFPMVPVRRETPYYLGIRFNAPYIWAYGEVEFPYPETVLYRDGI